MKKLINAFLNVFRFHKLKLLLTFVSFVLFTMMLFPFNDLGTLVSTQVAEQTQNTVFLKFDELGFSLIPSLGLKFVNAEVQTTSLPALKCDSLTLAPSILGFLTFRPGITADATGLFKGDVSVSTQTNKDTSGDAKEPKMYQKISINAEKINLNSLLGFFTSMTGLDGNIDVSIEGDVFPDFSKQPNMELEINGEKIQLNQFAIETPVGPFPLPDVSMKSIRIIGKLKEGKLEVEDGQLGTEQDELFTKFKGRLDVSVRNMGGQFAPMTGAYDLKVQIRAQKSFQDKAAIFLSFLENMKSPKSTPQTAEYTFRLAAQSLQAPTPPEPLATY